MEFFLISPLLKWLIPTILSNEGYEFTRQRVIRFIKHWRGDSLLDVYFQSIQLAFNTLRPRFAEYTPTGDLSINKDALQEVLDKLDLPLSQTISNGDAIHQELLRLFIENDVLEIGGHQLSPDGYKNFVSQLLNQAEVEFHKLLTNDHAYFAQAALAAFSESTNHILALERALRELGYSQQVVQVAVTELENSLETVIETVDITRETVNEHESEIASIRECLRIYRVTANIPVDVVRELFEQNSQWLLNERTQITGTSIEIPRAIVKKLFDWVLNDDSKQIALVSGRSGSGKTIAMTQLAQKLMRENIPVLAVRADAELYTNVKKWPDVDAAMELPASIIHCVQRLTMEIGRCVIIIDQLDTLASSMSGNPTLLGIFVEMINRLRANDHVRIIVPARYFEQTSDPQLRRLNADHQILLSDLTTDEINPVLAQLETPAFDHLPKPLQSILRLPLHLEIFAQVRSATDMPSVDYQNLHDLYDALWKLRVEESDDTDACKELISVLVNTMSRNHISEIPSELLDTYPETRTYLLGSGFIIQDGRSVRFFHTTLFGYCYARQFMSKGMSLAETVLNSPQALLERQLVYNVLTRMEGIPLYRQQYINELQQLLFPTEGQVLRYHLRELIIQWIATRPNPNDGEEQLIHQLHKGNLPYFALFIRSVSPDSGWWERLKTYLPNWLADDQTRDIALGFLHRFVHEFPQEIFSFILSYWQRGEKWKKRILSLILAQKNWQHADNLLPLLRQAIDSGIWGWILPDLKCMRLLALMRRLLATYFVYYVITISDNIRLSVYQMNCHKEYIRQRIN